ncbi:hypothetical protein LCGC14_1703330 [marine sediment metagenome]|uniref:Uncharacterized protein n=1 Tax=marine sediment metagenome TaxID=412755 RepID=A0A0F9KHD0_9ZZZZ
MKNPYRHILEDIVLESQVRANKAHFQLQVAGYAVEYSFEQYDLLRGAYKALDNMFKYIANKYNEVIDGKQRI